MKFAFMIVTRGNPKRAAAVLECAKSLASGKHEIQYVIGCDNDDDRTASYFHLNYHRQSYDNGHQPVDRSLIISSANRPTGVGEVWNRCATLAPDADIYIPFPDDVFIGLAHWDEYIASLNRPVLAWNDLANANQCSLPIVSREWLSMVGKLYDERFPFWFYDTCVDEIHSFVTGERVPIPRDLTLVSQKGLTQNLRELGFWWDFYVATRSERLALAATIRQKMGIELSTQALRDILRMWEQRDNVGRTTALEIEAGLSAEGRKPPSAQYLAARVHAQNYMDTLAAA